MGVFKKLKKESLGTFCLLIFVTSDSELKIRQHLLTIYAEKQEITFSCHCIFRKMIPTLENWPIYV